MTTSGPEIGETSSAGELDLEDLLTEIEAGNVVPVVGRDLLVLPSGKLLYHELALRLAEDLLVPRDELPEAPEIEDVAARYYDRPFPRGLTRHSPYEKLKSRLMKLPPDIPEPLAQLTAMSPLKVFLSTTPDDLLFKALSKRRLNVKAHTSAPESTDTVPAADLQGTSTVVCRLLGRADNRQQLPVTEDDLLEFVRDLQTKLDPMSGALHDLAGLLKKKQLLFLGCGYADWLMRFFIRIIRVDRFSSEGAREARVADARTGGKSPLVIFLQQYGNRVYSGDPAAFVAELKRQWDRRQLPAQAPVRPAAAAAAEPLVVLSSATGDEDLVTPIAERLERWGIGAAVIRWPDDDVASLTSRLEGAGAYVMCLPSTAPTAELGARHAEEMAVVGAKKQLFTVLLTRDEASRKRALSGPADGVQGIKWRWAPPPQAPELVARKIAEELLRTHRVSQLKRNIPLYCASASADEVFLKQFGSQIAVHKDWLTPWDRTKTSLGTEDEWQAQMAAASVIVLLVSADLGSECEPEIDAAIARHDQGSALVIPILVRACESELDTLPSLPEDRVAIADAPSRDKAWTGVIQRLVLDTLDFVLGRGRQGGG